MNQLSTSLISAIFMILFWSSLQATENDQSAASRNELNLCDKNISIGLGTTIRASSFHSIDYDTNEVTHKNYLVLVKGPNEYLSPNEKGENLWAGCKHRKVLDFVELPTIAENEQLNFDCHDFNEMANPPGVAIVGIVKSKYGLQKAKVSWIVNLNNKGRYITESKSKTDRIYCTVLPGIDSGG